MSRLRLKAPSPALVVACIALFAAIGGTSYAAFSLPNGSVGTPQLKNKAVTNAKLAPTSVGYAKIVNGAVGLAKLGVSQPATSVSVPANSRGTLTAACPSGTVVLDGGGGFPGVTGRYGLLSSSNTSGTTGWAVEGWNLTATSQTLVARAVCIRP